MRCLQAARGPAPAALQHEHAGSSSGGSVRCVPPCLQRRPCSRRPSRLHAAVVGDGQTMQRQQQQGPAGGNGVPPPPAAAAQQAGPVVALPEDFQLPPGQLSHVERSKPLAAADAFRCAACTRPECQVSSRGRRWVPAACLRSTCGGCCRRRGPCTLNRIPQPPLCRRRLGVQPCSGGQLPAATCVRC